MPSFAPISMIGFILASRAISMSDFTVMAVPVVFVRYVAVITWPAYSTGELSPQQR
jgi:hypothetical protein